MPDFKARRPNRSLLIIWPIPRRSVRILAEITITDTNITTTTADTDRPTDPSLSPKSTWHGHCFACSANHPQGLHLHGSLGADGTFQADFAPSAWMVGYDGRMHGGLIATLLDSAMTQCLFAQGIVAVTATLDIRYRQKVDLTGQYKVQAKLETTGSRVYRLSAAIMQGDRRMATAKAQFVQLAKLTEAKSSTGP